MLIELLSSSDKLFHKINDPIRSSRQAIPPKIASSLKENPALKYSVKLCNAWRTIGILRLLVFTTKRTKNRPIRHANVTWIVAYKGSAPPKIVAKCPAPKINEDKRTAKESPR